MTKSVNKMFICILVPFIISIILIGVYGQECCSASDFCCTTPTGSGDEIFHTPAGYDTPCVCFVQNFIKHTTQKIFFFYRSLKYNFTFFKTFSSHFD